MTNTAAKPNPVTTSRLEISIVSDVVCPWCFIGKRQLEQALRSLRSRAPDAPEPVLRWHAFQLNPTLPPEGMARSQYLLQKFGRADSAGIYERVQAAARQVGLELRLDAITRQPNTLKAHALIGLATEAGSQSQMVEALFDAYFMRGADLTDDAALRRLAEQVGLNDELIDAALNQPAIADQIAAADRDMRERGVSGVPLFIIGREGGRSVSVSGAQGAAALLQAIERSAQPQAA